MTNNNRPRFSAVLSRVGAEIAKLPSTEQQDIRAKFDAEVTKKDGMTPIDPTAFLGGGATGNEVADAFRF